MNDCIRIKTPIAEVIFYYNPIYVYHILDPVKIGLNDIKKHLDQTSELIKGYSQVRNLVDSRKMKGLSKAARDYSEAYDKKCKQTEKLALLVKSGISRIAGNLYLKFSTPSCPTQLFTDEQNAKEWLLQSSLNQ
ncbi:MAG: STAS/SEC14 domain-containing protein [Saprospiraceae bacterium]|nr:STAS/SEC14 domain-containing protein [Saprospiraceae bacterium]